MRDKTDEEIKEERAKAIVKASELMGEPVEVIDSFFEKAPVVALLNMIVLSRMTSTQ